MPSKECNALEQWQSRTVPRPQAISKEALIVAEPSAYLTWGSHKILQRPMRMRPKKAWPAASIIGDLPKREGLIQGRQTLRRTPPYTDPLRQAHDAHQVWSLDFKGYFGYRDGGQCGPFLATDGRQSVLGYAWKFGNHSVIPHFTALPLRFTPNTGRFETVPMPMPI
jgi:hypothetical protein